MPLNEKIIIENENVVVSLYFKSRCYKNIDLHIKAKLFHVQAKLANLCLLSS